MKKQNMLLNSLKVFFKERIIDEYLFLNIFFVEWLVELANLSLIYLDRPLMIQDFISLLIFPLLVLLHTRGVVDKVPLASIRGICLCYAMLIYLPAHVIYNVIEYNFYVEAGVFESTPTTILSKVFTPIISSLFSVTFCMESQL